jgi:hypothetical protein
MPLSLYRYFLGMLRRAGRKRAWKEWVLLWYTHVDGYWNHSCLLLLLSDLFSSIDGP